MNIAAVDCSGVCLYPHCIYALSRCIDTFEAYIYVSAWGFLSLLVQIVWAMRRPLYAGRVTVRSSPLFLYVCGKREDTINNEGSVWESSRTKQIIFMKKILVRRLFSSIVDKSLILLSFIVICIFISPYKMPALLGSYTSQLNDSPSDYHSLAITKSVIKTYGYDIYNNPERMRQCYDTIKDNHDLIISFENEMLFLDLFITGLFILVNLLYYIIFESIGSASLGKSLLKLVVVSGNNIEIGKKEAFKRCFLLFLLMLVAVGLRFIFDMNYYITIFVFFLIIDIPVFIKSESTIDIITNTHVIKKE